MKIPILLALGSAVFAGPSTLAQVPDRSTPPGLRQWETLEGRIKSAAKKAVDATVGLRSGAAMGSGVIVSASGYVLTAAHVFPRPDQRVDVILPDGRVVKGTGLGRQSAEDYGLIRIDDEGPWPYVEMGESGDLGPGDWCIATGHPGGYERGRSPVLRLGRVLSTRGPFLRTDCALIGGDSGGPLLDLHGRVIGIHSRISNSVTENYHVPVDKYREDWQRLADGESWGATRRFGRAERPALGILCRDEEEGCLVTRVTPDRPAATAGIVEGDVITGFAGQSISERGDLLRLLSRTEPGAEVVVEVLREEEKLELAVVFPAAEETEGESERDTRGREGRRGRRPDREEEE